MRVGVIRLELYAVIPEARVPACPATEPPADDPRRPRAVGTSSWTPLSHSVLGDLLPLHDIHAQKPPPDRARSDPLSDGSE
ncbi:hypothetical protein AB0N81_14125 [Streptomyces sp. NPDC093510]|uniref:hypothetical protein n=1 Tax=Streptomyces sp. NPDC093510 TaxID=3155199 RepID=UPI0034191ADA